MKNIALSFLMVLLTATIHCQSYTPPKVVPPSPQSQNFVKYIDYPVDYTNGLASVKVPLYTVKSGNISVPLVLSYHGSGLQPSAESGTIGLNWNFNFGGMITRSVKGAAKDTKNGLTVENEEGITTTSNLNDDPDFYTCANGSDGTNYTDWENDIFSYILPNISGKFILPKTGNINEFLTAKTLPYKPLKIATNDLLDYFELLDEEGNLYRFGKSILDNRVETEINYFPSVPVDHKGGVYTWLLTEIISSDKKDTLSFYYDEVDVPNIDPNYIKKLNRTNNRSISFDLIKGNMSVTSPNSYTGYEYTTKILKKIDYKLGYVKFTYLSETYPNQILNKIEVFDKSSSNPKQTIKLLQTKYHNNSQRLNWYKLDSVEFYSSRSSFINKYKFSYNTNIQFPLINDNISNETYSVDFWGFYNGATNDDMIPSFTLPSWADYTGMRGSADRNPSLSYTQAGILKKITLPEGGTVSFDYGLNKGNAQEDIGGLRIEKIVLKTGLNDSIVKSFSYFNPDYIPIQDEFFFSRNMNTDRSPGNCNNCVVETFTVSSSANFDFNIYGSPVVYGKVIEYFGNSNSNNGWIEHYYDHSFSHRTPDPLYNRFYNASYVDYLTTKMDWSTGDWYLSWVKFGDILENETKTFDVSGKCKEYVKRYYSHSINEAFRNLNVKRTINHASSSCCSNSILKVGCFEMYTYNIAQLKQQLDSINTFAYTENGAVKTTERFTYNNYSLLVQSEKQNSEGTVETLRTRYPSETNYSGMISKNMLAYPIEQSSLKNGNVISSSLTLYKSVLNTYVPDKVYTLDIHSSLNSFLPFNGTSRDSHYNVIPEITFDKYDESGNILQTTGINGIRTSYLWGYKQTYPVAKIEGADFTTASEAVNLSVLDNPSSDAVLRNELAKLRTALPNALITTYTYSPLIGMTSQTDPNGVTTYYEYDDFGRLKCVKDNNEKIMKTYDYHYKN